MRVLDEKGKQIGLFSREEALRKAQESCLDLVEIAPNAKPPVVKLIDFKKFKYLEAKRAQQIKKHAREVEVKEIRLRPFIGDHDFAVRISQAKQFLKNGNRLKIVVRFQGREFSKKEFGFKIITRFTEALAEVSEPQGEPRFEGRTLVVFLAPVKKSYAKDENKESSR
ncbi:translation initiation factor IF-3 [Candidatus Gottesmanbacteria bacterium]|nr:translation initiation factor IF-3 [Candidatus Gottesmanbacteria bacterium]MBI5465363.1 translation initiation factor IF-3 [Candidatus Gottesmanbacteria bacterium]